MVVTIFCILLSCVVAQAVCDEDKAIIDELRSAIVVSQLALSQQTMVLQELVKATQSVIKHDREEHFCPPPYSKILDECFYLSPHALNWNNARQHCHGLAGDLATPPRVYALFSFILDSGVSVSSRVWIGATDSQEVGTWKWFNGSSIISDWAENQPNNHRGKQHCLDVLMDRHPPLNDDDCSSKYRFVCQYHL